MSYECDFLVILFHNSRMRANETVEKLILGSTFSGQPLVERPNSGSEGGRTDVSLRHGSVEHSKRVDLTDIVNQREQSPLYIHFQFGTQSEAVHALLHTDVGKDRLDDCESSGIDLLSLFGIDLGFHLVDQVRWLRIHRDRKIPAR